MAALYTQIDSVYATLGADCWDKERDARNYTGTAPVVAHPPCARWSSLAAMHDDRYCSSAKPNRPDKRIGADGGMFASALANVRRCGGVLEHPYMSSAFADHWLGRPRPGTWQACICGGYVTEIEQANYGHPFTKRTWLYAYGIGYPPPLTWRASGGASFVPHKHKDEIPTSAKEREHTPTAFALVLMSLARRAYWHRP